MKRQESAFSSLPESPAASQPEPLTGDRAPRLCAPAGAGRGAGRTTPAAVAPPPYLERRDAGLFQNGRAGRVSREKVSRREERGHRPSLQPLRFLSSSTPRRSISSRRRSRSLISTRKLSVEMQGSVCTCKGKQKESSCQ